jgi:hypothetical protein
VRRGRIRRCATVVHAHRREIGAERRLEALARQKRQRCAAAARGG